MPNVAQDYLSSAKSREQAALAAMIADDEKWIQQGAVPVGQAAAKPTAAPAAAPVKKEPTPSFLGETSKAIVGGVVDATTNAWNMIDDAATWLDNNVLDLRIGSNTMGTVGGRKATQEGAFKEDLQLQTAKFLDNKTAGGKIARTFTQFAVPFAGGLRALKGVKAVGTAAKATAAGAAADFAAFDPMEKRLSNMVLDMTDQDSVFQNAVFKYLAANPNDSHMEGRFKNTLEGMGIGLATDGLFKGIKALKAHYTAKGVDPAVAVRQAGEEARAPAGPKTAADMVADATIAPERTLQDHINAVTGVKPKDAAAATAKREQRQGTISAFENPANQKQLDKWEKVVAETEANRNLANGQDNTKLFKANKSGDEVIIGGHDDPVVKDFGEAFRASTLPERAAQAAEVPGFLRSPEDLTVLRAYRQIQDATLEAFKRNFEIIEKKGAGQVISDEERRYLKTLSETDIAFAKERKGGQAFSDAERAGMRDEGAKMLADIKAKQEALEKLAPAFERWSKGSSKGSSKGDKTAGGKINPDGTFNFGTKNEGGFIDPATLVRAGAEASKGNIAAGVAAGGLTLTGTANAGDGTEQEIDWGERFSNAVVASLAGFAGYRYFRKGGAKAAAELTAETAHPVAKALAHPELRGVAPAAPEAIMTKKVPVIEKAKVAKMAELAASGKYKDVAKELADSDFNFDRIDTPDDVKDLVDGFSAVFSKEIDQATHGTKSFDQIKDLALELGAGVDTLKNLYGGTDNLASKVLAHRALLTASAEKVSKLSKLALENDSAEALLALRKQVALHASIQAQMKGVQTEIARALASFRITSTSVDLAVNERNALIDAMGGRKLNIEFAQKLEAIAGDPVKFNSVVRKTAMAKTQDAMFSGWVNGLLSAPATHATNLVANTATALFSIAERQGAALYGKIMRRGVGEGVEQAEVKAYMLGMYSGLRDAIRISSEGRGALLDATKKYLKGDRDGAVGVLRENSDEFGGAWEAFFHDAPVLDNAAFGTREFDQTIPAISSQHFDMDPTTFIGKFVDYAGGVIRTPGRLLTTADELFKTVFYRGELNAQAYRRAVQEGHQGDALFKRVSELVDDPLPEISGAAMDAARKGTFTSPIANEGFTGAALKVSQHPVGRYLLPFVRTPVNIIKYVGERTPVLRGMSDHVKADLAAGGARKDLAQARMVMGSGLFTIGAVLTASGVIQGGGEINKTAEQMNGWIPYSIKIGDSYYAYNRLDPIGMFLGLAADFTEISGHLDDKTAGELTSAFVLALNRNLASKTYLKGIFDLTNALTEEQRGNSGAFVRWMNNFGSSFMPFSSMSNAVRREVDPEVKEVWDLMDAYKSKIPGFSKDVLPQVNMFGEDVVYKDGLGPDIASPIMTSDAVSDVAATEIARLNIDLKSPPKKLTPVDGAPGIDLNQEQYYKLKKFMGTEFKTNVTKIIESPAYQNLPENLDNVGYKQSKVQVIQMVHAKAREVAVYKLLKEYPELAQAHKQLFINKGLAMRGQPVVPILAQQ